MKSLVTLASTVAVMACQTAVASSSLARQSPVPAVAEAQPASQQVTSQAVTASSHTKASVAVADGRSKRTWIIFGIIAAVVIAVVVITVAGGGADSIY